MRTTQAAVFLCLLAGCTDQGGVVTPTPTPLQAALAPGQSLIVYPERLTVTFFGVTADSRCPMGAECIWEGDGAARFFVQLVGLDPYPGSDRG